MSTGLGWVAFDVVERHLARRALCPRRHRPRLPRCHAGVGNSTGTGGGTACGQHHGGAVIRLHCCRKRFHDLLRWPEDRSRARVHVGHAHQCRHRFDLDLPQDACLGRAGRARHRADVGRQPGDDAGGRQPARRALQGGGRPLAHAARDAVDVPDGAPGRQRGQGGDRAARRRPGRRRIPISTPPSSSAARSRAPSRGCS